MRNNYAFNPLGVKPKSLIRNNKVRIKLFYPLFYTSFFFLQIKIQCAQVAEQIKSPLAFPLKSKRIAIMRNIPKFRKISAIIVFLTFITADDDFVLLF